MKHIVIFLVFTASLAGCSLAPYEEEFACRKKDQLGKCISMQDAYEEAVTGKNMHPSIIKKSEQNGEEPSSSSVASVAATPNEAYDRYVNSYYNEITSMVDNPVTPLVKQAKTIRTLILPYPGTGDSKTLWMERYAYTIVEEPNFVMGQYLTKKPELLETLLKNKSE